MQFTELCQQRLSVIRGVREARKHSRDYDVFSTESALLIVSTSNRTANWVPLFKIARVLKIFNCDLFGEILRMEPNAYTCL